MVASKSIPYDKDLAFQITKEMAEEIDNLFLFDGVRVELEKYVSPAYTRNRGELFPVEVVLQNRCFSAWCPCSHHDRRLRKPTFINEHYGSLFVGFFYRRPLLLFPFRNLGFIPFKSSFRRLLATPSNALQHFPDMGLMIRDPEFPLDYLHNSRKGPKTYLIPEC